VQPSLLLLEQLDAPLVLAFLEHLEAKRGNSASTRNMRGEAGTAVGEFGIIGA
jgi:hypothetical protein